MCTQSWIPVLPPEGSSEAGILKLVREEYFASVEPNMETCFKAALVGQEALQQFAHLTS